VLYFGIFLGLQLTSHLNLLFLKLSVVTFSKGVGAVFKNIVVFTYRFGKSVSQQDLMWALPENDLQPAKHIAIFS
jgi:hypothetical protein